MTHAQKLEAALVYLGQNWVLAKNSTYDAGKRAYYGSSVLKPPKAVKK